MSSKVTGHACPICEGTNVTIVPYVDMFKYRVGDHLVELKAEYPVESCKTCNFVSSGEEAEVAKDTAVRNFLGILLPKQIKDIRESCGLTRQKFSELTGIGTASLSRWENGELIQNKSSDSLIRLLSNKKNIAALTGRSSLESKFINKESLPKMRALQGDDFAIAIIHSTAFQLNIKRKNEVSCTL